MSGPVLGGILIAVITSLGAYLAAVRKLSGEIKTSEAATLWEESRKMRDDYRSRITELNEVLSRCEERIDLLEKRNNELYAENGRLGRMIEQHEHTIAELRSQVHRLSEKNDTLEGENRDLRERLTGLEAG